MMLKFFPPTRFRPVHLLLGALLAQVLLFTETTWASREISPNRECSICHVMWLTDFTRKDAATLIPYDPKPVVDTGKQDVVSTERMCFSCHDGFVLDSRFAWAKREHFHPVGIKPPKDIKIPTLDGKTVFPMNEEGKIYCGTCHSAHGVDWEKEKFSPVFLRVRNVNSSLCLACHIDRATGTKEGNHPMFKNIERIGKVPQELREAGSKFGGKHQNKVICQSCHRIHGAADKKLLAVNKHELCITCHADKKGVDGTKHDAAIMTKKGLLLEPDTGLCTACHKPHFGKGPRMWAWKLKKGENRITAMCLSCHNPQGVAKDKVISKKHTHPIGVSIEKVGISATRKKWKAVDDTLYLKEPLRPLPLYDKNGNRVSKGGQVVCTTCHDPHNWSTLPPKLRPDPLAEGDGRGSFLRIPFDEKARLCTNCHVDKAMIAYSKHNLRISSPKNAGKTSGGGLCGDCHRPHDGTGPNLWARKFGPGNDTIEKMCRDCHQEGGMAENKLTGKNFHPVGVDINRLVFNPEPDLPLFSRSGKLGYGEGRVSCGTCHNPHQWNPRDPADLEGAFPDVEGNGQNSFLRIPAAPGEDLCVECHTDKRFIKGTDHDLNVTGPNQPNAAGDTVDKTGICGQCHMVHNAPHRLRLWARDLGPGKNPQEQLCRSCHDKGKFAGNKLPPYLTHPVEIRGISMRGGQPTKGKKGHRPVFDDQGHEARSGVITCPTCHNPHKWSDIRPRPGPGKNREGDVRNSFLRDPRNVDLCANCHGMDAIFRFKYFHAEASRRKHRLYE